LIIICQDYVGGDDDNNNNNEGKVIVLPTTGHEGPEGE
jgi:hypothetical protein